MAALPLVGLVSKLIGLYDEEGYDIPSIKRAIVRYLLACTKDREESASGEAPEHVAQAEEVFRMIRQQYDEGVVLSAQVLDLSRAALEIGRALLRTLRDEGRVMLVSTHNLGSVPQFCDHVVLINRTILAYGPTGEVFTQANIERAFGGVRALPTSFLVVSGKSLPTRFDGPTRVTAPVPDCVLGAPGRYSVSMVDLNGESDRVEFLAAS